MLVKDNIFPASSYILLSITRYYHHFFQMICDTLILEFSLFKISLSKVLSFLLKACCGICQRWMGSHTIVSWAQDPPRVTLSLSLALTKG